MPIEIAELVVRASYSTQRSIEIDGTKLPDDIDAQIESAVVIDRLTMADTFTIVFRDPDRRILELAGCEIGKRVTISTASTTEDAPAVLIKGEITSLEADYDSLGARAVIRGYDLSHRLTAGCRSQVFKDVKYSDIARTIAREAGLEADVDDSPGTHVHVIQANLSDLAFLSSLAGRIDFDCRVEGDTLRFKKRLPSSSGPAEGGNASQRPEQLVWNDNLIEFRGRISAVSQVAKVQVRGWNVDDKVAVIGEADAATASTELPLKPADLAGKVGRRTHVIVDRPVGSQAEADALAHAKAEEIGSAAYEASAVANGSPALRAGVVVNISGVDKALTGKWVVTMSRHEFGNGSYRTYLECTGRQDRSLHGLVTNGMPGASRDVQRIPGLVIAIVTDNNDPQSRGRVKLRYPWLADEVDSTWARVAAPGAGPEYGLVWIPQIDDEVLVGFEQGDIGRPFVLGGLWNGKDTAPLGTDLPKEGKITRSGFISRSGHKLVFFDGPQETGIALISANGKYAVSLNETRNELHVKADGKLLIEAQSLEIKVKGSAELKADGGVSLEAASQMKIKGATVAIN